MCDLFSDIFTLRENRLTRFDPRIKIFVILCCLVTLVLSRGFTYPLIILCMSMGGLMAVRIPLPFVAFRLLMPAVIVSVLILIKLFLTPGEPLVRYALWGMIVTVTREGLVIAGSTGVRVMSAVTVLILFGSVTPAHSIFHAMRWMRVPREWVEVALLMYRYIFVLLETTANMATAQRLRLSYVGVRNSFRSAGVLCGAVMLKSVDQAVKTGQAMLLRGQSGSVPLSPMPRFSLKSAVVAATSCLFIVLVYGVCEWLLP